jgi:hypothetical protein
MSDDFPPVLSIETLAYVAGLFDGEGSIVIGCSPGRTKQRNPSYWLQVSITNTDKQLIDWLHDTFRGHIADNSHCPSRGKQRPCWAWRVTSKQAQSFLQKILPYLRTKKPQALIAIEFQDHKTTFTSTKVLSPELLEVRERYRNKLRSLTLGAHNL